MKYKYIPFGNMNIWIGIFEQETLEVKGPSIGPININFI